MLMEYEVHFYSSGVIEERWKLEDLSENFAVASLGSVCGALLTVALLILGALLFLPRGIFPEHLSTATVAIAAPLGRRGMLFGLLGAMACMSGAAVETMLSGAYNFCQFFDWPWGKNSPIKSVPTFTKSWIGMLAIALLLVLSGLRPSQLVNLSVIFGMVVMPFTYYPVLRVAMDEGIMGKHVNQTMDTALGAAILVLIVGAAVAAIPLMLATDFGRP
jgi:Mn2+/Fe2+ NRAMP family transporter